MRWIVAPPLMGFAPFVLASALVSMEQASWFSLELHVLAVCVIVGLAGVAILPVSAVLRVATGIVYAPVMAILTFYWVLAFACAGYGACL